jgi:hypothetical protein
MQTGLTANDIRPVRALNVSGDFFNVLGVVPIHRVGLLRTPETLTPLLFQQLEVSPQMLYRSIERHQAPVRSRLHHASLHHRQHKTRERSAIHIRRKSRARILQAAFDRRRPTGAITTGHRVSTYSRSTASSNSSFVLKK